MLTIAITMVVILALAALVLVFAAFPHRGEQVPAVPWLGEAMERAADIVPVLPPQSPEGEWSPTSAPPRQDSGSVRTSG